MSFSAAAFIPFVVLVWLVWLILVRRGGSGLWFLALVSLVYYSLYQPAWAALLLACTLFGWWMGLALAVGQNPKRTLIIAVGLNLALLAGLKYTPFVFQTLGALGLAVPERPLWTAPAGVSFFTFTAIAYLVDVYRRKTIAEPDPVRFGVFLSFFPKLMAGPIVRPDQFLPDLASPPPLTGRERAEAFWLFSRGLAKKLILADRIGAAVDPFFAHAGDPSTLGVWALPYVYLYALQIYFDFSGYTDMARGVGLWFGFRWPENFNRPYLAASVRAFWRRWHMTLSFFFRDYVYIPLGGNRKGWTRTALNTLATTLLCGLWHGPSWSFVLWGGLHGGYMVLERLWSGTGPAKWLNGLSGPGRMIYRAWSIFLTFNAVTMAWTFFRISDFHQALITARNWFVFEPGKALVGGAADWSVWLPIAVYMVLAGILGRPKAKPEEAARLQLPGVSFGPTLAWGAGTGLIILAYILAPETSGSQFIYFQF